MKKTHLLFGSCALALALAAQTPVAAPHLGRGEADAVGPAIPDDPELGKVIAPLAAEIHASFGRVLVTCPGGLGKGGPGDSPLGFFLADVMREGAARAVGGDVRFAFTNSGGLRRNIPPGEVHVQDIYEVLPFDNELVVAEYTGAEVIAIVKEGLLKRGGEPCSGIRASVSGTVDHPVVTVTWSDGTRIDPAATYRAATTDYLLANGDATPTLKNGRHVVPTGVPVRQLVIDLCERRGKAGQALLAPEGGRYVISQDLSEALRARTVKF